VPRFKATAEQRSYMLSFEQQLHKDLELTPLQRQSHEWGSRCCGLDLDVLFKPIERALQRRKERKLRRQIAQELEQLKAAGRR
jgi:putative hemolysin